jgi:hypothetical protein
MIDTFRDPDERQQSIDGRVGEEVEGRPGLNGYMDCAEATLLGEYRQ